MRLDQVYEKITEERHNQIRKWGKQCKSREQWATILLEEVLEYLRAVNDGEPENRTREELVQVAAVACQILEEENV